MNKTATLVALALITSTAAAAYEPGNLILRAGAIQMDPDVLSDDVSRNGSPTGGHFDLDEDTQLGLTATYMIAPRIGVELLIATPLESTVRATGALSNLADVAEISQLPTTLSAVYYLSDDQQFKPYVGLGFNHSKFYDEEGLGSFADERVKFEDSTGIAMQFGVDLQLDSRLIANASVRWMDIETEADLKSNGSSYKATLDIDPLFYSVMIGYRF